MVMITLQHKRRVLAQLAKQGKEQLQQAKAEIAEPEKPTAVAVPQVVLSTNPALAHKQRVLHRLGQVQLVDSLTDGHAQKSLSTLDDDNQQPLVIAELASDVKALQAIASISEKAAFKVGLVNKYLPLVDAYISSGAQFKNPLLVYVLIWLLDTEQMGKAIDVAEVAIEQNQKMPTHFKRELSDFVVEEFAEWACRQCKAKQSVLPYLSNVIALVESGAWPVDEPIILGKLYRYAGEYHYLLNEYEHALPLFQKAQEANEQAGCKGRIKDCLAKLGL